MISKLIIRDKVFVSILLCAFFTTQVAAQSPDIFRLEYMLMPKNKADAELSRIKLVANVPLKVKESDNIILGAEYNYLSQEYGDNSSFEMEGIKNLHVVDLNLAYVYITMRRWRA